MYEKYWIQFANTDLSIVNECVIECPPQIIKGIYKFFNKALIKFAPIEEIEFLDWKIEEVTEQEYQDNEHFQKLPIITI